MIIVRHIVLLLLVFVYESAYSQDTTKTFFPSGHIKLLRVKIDSNTFYEKEFYESGQILSDGYIRFLMGKWRMIGGKVYWENGQLESFACDTSMNIFDKYGQLFVHAQIKNGIPNGLRYIYGDGHLIYTIEYKNDKKDGQLIAYDEQGKVNSKENYKEDKREGISEYFDTAGHVTKRTVYKNDIPLKVTYYDEHGKVVKITDGNKEYEEEKEINKFSKKVFSKQ